MRVNRDAHPLGEYTHERTGWAASPWAPDPEPVASIEERIAQIVERIAANMAENAPCPLVAKQPEFDPCGDVSGGHVCVLPDGHASKIHADGPDGTVRTQWLRTNWIPITSTHWGEDGPGIGAIPLSRLGLGYCIRRADARIDPTVLRRRGGP